MNNPNIAPRTGRMKVARIPGRHEGTWRYICGGAQIRAYQRRSDSGHPPIDEIRWLRVRVPGLVVGTPEDWNRALQSAATAAWGGR